MNSVRSNDISLKYQKCNTLASKAIGIINSEFVAKTQLLSQIPGYLANFPSAKVFGKFPKYPAIWEFSKILKCIKLKFLEILGISQMPGYL